jgi:hypothetical protein
MIRRKESRDLSKTRLNKSKKRIRDGGREKIKGRRGIREKKK